MAAPLEGLLLETLIWQTSVHCHRHYLTMQVCYVQIVAKMGRVVGFKVCDLIITLQGPFHVCIA